MQKCIKCGFENPDGIKFCGSCGNDLAQATPEKPVEKILAQSESYSKELERNWNSENEKLQKAMNSISIFLLIVCLIPLFADLGDDKKFSYALVDWVGSIFPWIYLISVVGMEILKRYVHNEARSIYDCWQHYCRKESLVVSNTRVIGTTDNGNEIQLSYKNIKSVSTRHYANTGSLRFVSNDILEIRDISNKIIEFRTFTNARQLQTAIEMQKRSK